MHFMPLPPLPTGEKSLKKRVNDAFNDIIESMTSAKSDTLIKRVFNKGQLMSVTVTIDEIKR